MDPLGLEDNDWKKNEDTGKYERRYKGQKYYRDTKKGKIYTEVDKVKYESGRIKGQKGKSWDDVALDKMHRTRKMWEKAKGRGSKGSDILKKIEKDDNQLTIVVGTPVEKKGIPLETGAYATPENGNWTDATKGGVHNNNLGPDLKGTGKGTNAEIYFDPDMQQSRGKHTMDPRLQHAKAFKGNRNYDPENVLVHEANHAYEFMSGTFSDRGTSEVNSMRAANAHRWNRWDNNREYFPIRTKYFNRPGNDVGNRYPNDKPIFDSLLKEYMKSRK